MIRSIRFGHAPNCSSLGNVLNTLVWTQAAAAAVWVAAEAWAVRRRRRDADGETLVVDDPPALVHTCDTPATGPPLPPEAVLGPVEAHLQITRACGLPCPTCYVEPSATGPSVPLETLDARLRDLAGRGILRVAFGGGEVLRHPQLADLPALAERHGLTTGVTTSGMGLTPERAAALSAFDQVNISLDGLGATYVATRGYDGAGAALDAISTLAGAGRRVGVNVVLDRHTFVQLAETVRAAVDAGARDIQLLRLKPAGRAHAVYLERRLTPEQGLALWPLAQELMRAHPDVTFRMDCALVPFLAAHGVDPERMRAFGFYGCHGGDALVSVDTDGNAHPCSFHAGPITPEWHSGVTTGPCTSCTYRDICRGGCHVVSAAVGGGLFAPDPECPLVRG